MVDTSGLMEGLTRIHGVRMTVPPKAVQSIAATWQIIPICAAFATAKIRPAAGH
jgi:hypothetical protein